MRITVLGKSPSWQDADGAVGPSDPGGGIPCAARLRAPGVFGKLRGSCDYGDGRHGPGHAHLPADHILDLVPFASGLRFAPPPCRRAPAARVRG